MKPIFVNPTLICFIILITICSLYADDRNFDNGDYHSASNIKLRVSNFGVLGRSEYSISSSLDHLISLEYPAGSCINYLSEGAIWIGGKRPRRNADGELLYWLAQTPWASPPDSARTITQDDPLWTPTKKVVLDTLTSVGYDGDADLFELLPAYNPLLSSNTDVHQLYLDYILQDDVLLSIAGNPSPRQFQIPDPLGTYCFSIPSDVPDNNPGYETLTAFYYDYDPFGTPGDRDWGESRAYSKHYPLGLAIEQQSYAWPLQDYSNEIIIKYIIKNTSTLDTLYDVNVGMFMDINCGPVSWGANSSDEDVCGYCPGEGYEFAYARDADGDGGLTTGIVGAKINIPNKNLNHAAWFWRVGDGPDDSDPYLLQPHFSPRITANEKYWLMKGKNPNTTKYLNLRPDGLSDYEQQSPTDTRFMLSYYGAQPDTPQYSEFQNRLFIAPNSEIVVYVSIIANESLAQLKETSQAVENLIDDNINIQVDPNSTSIPLLQDLQQTMINTVNLNWFSYTNPNHFEMMYKLADAPASTWQSISMPGSARTGGISFLQNGLEYKFKIAAIFYMDGNEVYMETDVQALTIDNDNTSVTIFKPTINAYPNPFNTVTKISIKGVATPPHSVDIFDVKGRKVRTFNSSEITNTMAWDGRNNDGNRISSGIYFIHMHSEGKNLVQKVLFLK
jgi:hypothetical protein